jgi:site-specific DNA-cytosine methylase
MLRRPLADIPDVDVYVCGFPCTPYSFIRRPSETRLFQEKAARPYKKTLEVLRAKLPSLAILENVMGLNRVMRKVVRDLERLRAYFVIIVPINSIHLGDPVPRPRYYILLVRRDRCLLSDIGTVAQFVATCLGAVRRRSTDRIEDLMLPSDHCLVRDRGSAKRTSTSRGTRWKARHARFADGVRMLGCGSGSASRPSDMQLPPGRMQDVWRLLLQKHHTGDLVADVSASVDRAHPHFAGTCCTLTPRSLVCVQKVGRVILPVEKLLLHGFPLHMMDLPKITGDAMSLLGGNTMHLRSVGLALLVGLSLCRWHMPVLTDSVFYLALSGSLQNRLRFQRA